MGNSSSSDDTFTELDADGNGRLDFDEILAAARRMDSTVDDATIRKWIVDHDADSDGVLDRDEFVRLMDELRAAADSRAGQIVRPPCVDLDIVEPEPEDDAAEGTSWGAGRSNVEADGEGDEAEGPDGEAYRTTDRLLDIEEGEEDDASALVGEARDTMIENAEDSQHGALDELEQAPPSPNMVLSLLVLAMQKLGMVLSVPAALRELPELWVKYFGWVAFFNLGAWSEHTACGVLWLRSRGHWRLASNLRARIGARANWGLVALPTLE